MNSFEYAAPKKLKEAIGLLGSRWNETEIMAGGTDLVTSLKQGLLAPQRVVSLRHLSELAKIKSSNKGLEIGSMVTLEELAADGTARALFPSVVQAIEGIGSAQMLAVGTVGGELCQRPRCWYYRNGYGLLAKEGDVSLVQKGDNRFHAIFATDGPALFVHPSSLGPPLIALGATLRVMNSNGKEREIPAGEFFRVPAANTERETALTPSDLLTGIFIPNSGLKNATYEVRHRQGLDWPYVTASVAFELKAKVVVNQPRVVLGHVAPVPWKAEKAVGVLARATINEAVAARCGEAAVEGAKPLSQNAYKVTLVKTAVKRAVLLAAG